MLLLSKDEYSKYKNISQKIIKLLVDENCSSLNDIEIIYNTIRGFPYCIDREGHYIYKREFYDSLEKLPSKGLMDLHNIYLSKFS